MDGGMNRMTNGESFEAWARVRRRPLMPTGNGANVDGSSAAVPLSPSLFLPTSCASLGAVANQSPQS